MTFDDPGQLVLSQARLRWHQVAAIFLYLLILKYIEGYGTYSSFFNLWKLKHLFLSLLIVGSYIPWTYYGLYCHETAKVYSVNIIHLIF